MKLTIKELAPYLPYGIPAKLSQKGIFNLDEEYPNEMARKTGLIKNISFWHPEITGQLHITETYSFDFDELDEVDIILRPLSDLTKEIEHKGQKLVPIVELLKIKHKGWVIEKLNTRYSEIEFSKNNNYAKACFSFMATLSIEVWLKFTENEPYWVCQKLNEWHFDWKDNLIENNLAIDINTINK